MSTILSNNLNTLVDFASQVSLSHHSYIEKTEDGFALTNHKTHSQVFTKLVEDIISNIQHLDKHQQTQVYAALDRVESHLNSKISGLFSFLIRKQDKNRIQGMIVDIENAKHVLQSSQQPETEKEARLKFYAELPNQLNVKKAATKDLDAIKTISQTIWNKFQNYDDYAKHMKMFFEGEHLLFEENDDYQLYEQLKDPKLGAYLRGSSHYDHGTLNGKTGGAVPSQQEIDKGLVDNPQYECEGPQVKALLFGRVKLALDDKGKPIFGKTFEQVCEEAKISHKPLPTKFRKYTFMQTEWAPDSESFLTSNFWKHRILSFCLYTTRKILGLSKPNVGPYGYGHADKGKNEFSNPTVI